MTKAFAAVFAKQFGAHTGKQRAVEGAPVGHPLAQHHGASGGRFDYARGADGYAEDFKHRSPCPAGLALAGRNARPGTGAASSSRRTRVKFLWVVAHPAGNAGSKNTGPRLVVRPS
jgi:hypothetical protein